MTSEYVKIITGVDNPQLDAIFDSVTRQMLYKLRELRVTTVPEELQHIVDEITIARYNLIGSEGMKNESVEGHSATYEGVTFETYEHEIVDYIREQKGEILRENVVRFI